MQATFTITGSELSPTLFEQIKSMFRGDAKNFEVTIRVKPKESAESNRQRIEQAAREMERGENVVQFTGVEFEQLVQELSKR
jgi:hypothetical protein